MAAWQGGQGGHCPLAETFKGAAKLVKGAKFDHDHNPVSSYLDQLAVKGVKVAFIGVPCLVK